MKMDKQEQSKKLKVVLVNKIASLVKAIEGYKNWKGENTKIVISEAIIAKLIGITPAYLNQLKNGNQYSEDALKEKIARLEELIGKFSEEGIVGRKRILDVKNKKSTKKESSRRAFLLAGSTTLGVALGSLGTHAYIDSRKPIVVKRVVKLHRYYGETHPIFNEKIKDWLAEINLKCKSIQIE